VITRLLGSAGPWPSRHGSGRPVRASPICRQSLMEVSRQFEASVPSVIFLAHESPCRLNLSPNLAEPFIAPPEGSHCPYVFSYQWRTEYSSVCSSAGRRCRCPNSFLDSRSADGHATKHEKDQRSLFHARKAAARGNWRKTRRGRKQVYSYE